MHATRDELALGSAGGDEESREAQWGEMTVAFSTVTETDPASLFVGLPGDRCPCPHWGYVLRGRLVYDVGGSREELPAGAAYYLPPGHLALECDPGTQILEFSPTQMLATVVEHIGKRMTELGLT